MKRLSMWLMVCAVSLAPVAPVQAELQGSVFTYQGRLEQNGAPVQGTRNLRFRLFTQATGGTQVGSDIALPAQPVDGGVFTVPLDFGLLAFNGEARFLEIAVDDNTLSPRQLVTNAPYALFALDGGTPYSAGPGIAIVNDTISANFGTTAGTVAQGNTVILNQTSLQAGGNFNISGRGRMDNLRIASAVADSGLMALRVSSPNTGGFDTDRLRVDTTGNIVAIGETGVGIIPHSGSGTRLVWFAQRGAFRAGGVDGVQWDDASMGLFSAAFGFSTRAAGQTSFAAGVNNEATATGSTVFGTGNAVSGANGFAAGSTNTCSGSGCVALGTLLTADANFSTALGRRVSSGGFAGSFIWGDDSATVASNTAANQFMARASGGFRFRTSANLGTGCDLPAGSGVFSCTSNRNAKHDFRAVDAEDILLRVVALPVDSWRYREERDGVRHLGPTAQDFHAAFGLGTDDVSIGLLDIDGVNMLAIQALAARTEALARKDAEIDELRARLDILTAAVAKLQARLE